MALTPDDIERRQFTVASTGYDRDEVDAFLVETAASLRAGPRSLPTLVPRLPARTPRVNGSSAAATAPVDPTDAGRTTAGRTDAGRTDAGRTDAGRTDAGRTDAGPGPGPTRIATAHVASEVANILDAAQQAGATMLAEAENDAARVRASAERDAAQAREATEQDRERVKRLLLRSEEQAASIIAQAEQQAHQQVAMAERDTRRRTREALARTQRRTEELEQAERTATEALRHIRAQLDLALGSQPDGTADRRGDENDPTPDIIDIRSSATGECEPDEDLTPPDPTTRLIRAAVSRAANSGAATRT